MAFSNTSLASNWWPVDGEMYLQYQRQATANLHIEENGAFGTLHTAPCTLHIEIWRSICSTVSLVIQCGMPNTAYEAWCGLQLPSLGAIYHGYEAYPDSLSRWSDLGLSFSWTCWLSNWVIDSMTLYWVSIVR